MTFFGSLALVVVLVIRPQEIWPWLEALHLLDVFTGLVLLGLIVEITLGKQKYLYSPQLPFVAAFLATCYLVTAISVGAGRAITACNKIPAIFMLAVMYGSGTRARLRSMLWTILLLGAFVSAVAAHQGSREKQCIERVVDDFGALTPDLDTADGRACGMPSDCRIEDQWEIEWACERVGLFKTVSTGGRVRWRGQLGDPNELSVFIGAVIPLLFAVGLPIRNPASNRGPGSQKLLGVLAVVMVAVGLYAVILSQSRGGQLVIATVFAFMFVSRFGKKGLVLAMIVALPVLLLGGRDDPDAEASSMERLELLAQGAKLVIMHPFRGVGVDQFTDQVDHPSHLTAHNSYLLAAAEIGFPGFFFWSGMMWTSLKIPLTALKAERLPPEVRAVANALLVSFTGITVGIFFLSFTYKQLLFVWFGLVGAFYLVVREADPDLRVTVGWKDCVGLVLADFGVIGLIYGYTRARGVG